MESEDYAFYQGLVFLSEHHVSELGYELTFSTEVSQKTIIIESFSLWQREGKFGLCDLDKNFLERSEV